MGTGLRAGISRWGFLFLCLLLFYNTSDPDGSTWHDHELSVCY